MISQISDEYVLYNSNELQYCISNMFQMRCDLGYFTDELNI